MLPHVDMKSLKIDPCNYVGFLHPFLVSCVSSFLSEDFLHDPEMLLSSRLKQKSKKHSSIPFIPLHIRSFRQLRCKYCFIYFSFCSYNVVRQYLVECCSLSLSLYFSVLIHSRSIHRFLLFMIVSNLILESIKYRGDSSFFRLGNLYQ